ncbi:hypothetical protein SY88_07335 [Clostridiales bacterium PH28_bin88]|nr:hypothetical protein SY88_07335 [Clostridiales bacterium PH28_bin88]
MQGIHQEEVLGKAYDSVLMRRLLGYVRPYRHWVLMAVLLLAAITATDLVRPLLVQQAIDNYLTVPVSREVAVAGLWRLGGLYFLAILLNFLLSYGQAYLLQFTGQKIIYDIRLQVFTHLQRMSLSFFDRNPVGRLVTRVTNDTETLNEMYTSVLVNLFKDLFLLAGIILVMLRLDVGLALVSFTGLPLVLVATRLYQGQAREAYRMVRTRLARLNAFLAEHISGMRVIQIFHREQAKQAEFEQVNHDHYQASMRELFTFAVFRPSMDFIYSLVLAMLLWYGGGQIIREHVSFGVLYAFINYIEQFFRPINDLSEKYTILQSAMASSERIFQLLDRPPEITEPANPVPLPLVRGRIEFDGVWFAYEPGEWVLKDVSFSIEPGETVAFVGATGAGKTSIISLISRLYDVQQGEIRIDGVNIKDVALSHLRRHIGVVMQDVFLFAGDIQGNIRLNNEEISDRRVREVAGYVNADHFIRLLPNGYAEEVKERGATLSTGQRQLLAFARALAFDPAILVLDEATANIDTETELLIQDALKKITRGRTTIVIAHRLSTIQHADRIIVLHRGRVRETGTHQELLARGGMYYDLYQLQYRDGMGGENGANHRV